MLKARVYFNPFLSWITRTEKKKKRSENFVILSAFVGYIGRLRITE